MMSDNIDHIEKALRSLIEVVHDGQKGFSESAKEIEDPSIKTFFIEEGQTRAQFAEELEDSLYHLGISSQKASGTATGALHRTWAELKAKLGGSDHTLLVTAEQGEDEAKKAYAKTLKEHLPAEIDTLLRRQQQHVIQAHNKVRIWRDTKQNER